MEKNEKLVNYLMEKTLLTKEEIENMDDDRFIELFNDHFKEDYGMDIEQAITTIWKAVKSAFDNICRAMNDWVYEQLADITYADEEYLKKNIEFSVALNIVKNYLVNE